MILSPLGKHFPTANAALGKSNLPRAILQLLWVTDHCSASSLLPLCLLSKAEGWDMHPETAFARGKTGLNKSSLNFERW